MKLSGEGKLLRIFLGELDKYKHQSLFDTIVLKARENGLAGATVFRAIEGYGAGSRVVHTAKILRLSEDLPLLIEIVDTVEKITSFLPVLDEILEEAGCGGLMTMEKVEVIRYTPGNK
jgi:PII-like signaling protein